MSHLHLGDLQAFVDGALDHDQQVRVQAHLSQCSTCWSQVELLKSRRQQIQQALAALEPVPKTESALFDSQAAQAAAQQRLKARLNQLEQEKQPMWQKFTRRVSAQAGAGLAIVLLLALALAFPQVRAAADSFLGLFRVQRFQVVQVNDNIAGGLENSANLEAMFSQNVQITEDGEPQTVQDAAAAAALVGFQVRLPQAVEGPLTLRVQPGGTVTLRLDLELMRAILKDMERQDIQLPDTLDGAVVTVQVPASVIALYGQCGPVQPGQDPDEPQSSGPECTTLVQLPSPTLIAPPELDATQIGEAYLQLLGLSREEAEQFARRVDWSTTFVIPIPRYDTRFRELTVEGVSGTLIEHGQEYLLLWIKDGIVYALSGVGNSFKALRIAQSLE